MFVVTVWYAAVTRVNFRFASSCFSGGFLSGCHFRHSLRYAAFTAARSPRLESGRPRM